MAIDKEKDKNQISIGERVRLHRINRILLIILIILIGLDINGAYNFPSDTFLSSSIVGADLISKFGDVKSAISYLQIINTITTFSWTWQYHTYTHLMYFPISSIIIYIISSICNISFFKFSEFFVLYFVILLVFIILTKRILGPQEKPISIEIILTLGFIAFYLLGKFYMLEYHAIGLLLYLLFVYSFFSLLTSGSSHKISYVLLIIVIYLALVLTYQKYPGMIIAGMIMIILVYINKFRIKTAGLYLRLMIMLIIILFFAQSFYIMLLERGISISNFFEILSRLIMFKKVEKSISTWNTGVFDPVRKFLYISWNISGILLSTYILGRVLTTKKHINLYEYIIIFILGASIFRLLSYSIYYKKLTGEIITTPYLLSIALIRANWVIVSRKSNKKYLSKILRILTVIFVVSLITWSFFEAYRVLHFSGVSSIPMIQSEQSRGFLIKNFPYNSQPSVVTGDHQVLARMYIEFTTQNNSIVLYKKIILENLAYYISRTNRNEKKISQLLLNRKVDYIIFTKYGLEKAMFGDVLPLYLPSNNSQNFFKIMLLTSTNYIYSSEYSKILKIEYGGKRS